MRFPGRVLMCIFVCIFSTAALPVQSLTVGLPTFDNAYKRADLVEVIRIERVTPHALGAAECGIAYSGTILRSMKGAHTFQNRYHLSFGRMAGLQAGSTYLLFLKRMTNVQSELDRVRAIHPEVRKPKLTPHLARLIECRGIIPGFIFDSDFALSVRGGTAAVNGLWAIGDVPKSVKIVRHEGLLWVVDARDLFAYLNGLRR